ncbi:MAG: PIN domain-containing protein [Bacteroidota bacterium]
MKKLIIDSNIFYAALRAKHSKTRRRLLTSPHQFFTANFLFVEIFKHKERILEKSDASEDEVYEFLAELLNVVQFINEQQISTANIVHAFRLCKDIDEKDTILVALSLEFGYRIWTRDDELKEGLKRKGFDHFFDDEDFEDLE